MRTDARHPSELAPAAGSIERIAALDGIRGFACLLVVFGHYFGEVPHGLRFLRLEWLGVDLFFCLSGFLIGGILLENRASPSYFSTFYARRGFRILPIYLVTVSLVLLALPHFGSQPGTTYSPLIYFAYVQNFVMAATGIETSKWLMPTWTLCVEEQFYLLLPVILYLVPPRRLLAVLLLLIMSGALFRAGLVLASANRLALAMLLPSQWSLLFFGVLAAYARRTPTLWSRLAANGRRLLKGVVFAGIGGLMVLVALDNLLGWRSVDMFGELAFGTILTGFLALVADGAPEGRRFRAPALCCVGRISYGLYLIHQPIAAVVHRLLLGTDPDIATPAQIAATIVALALAVTVAALSWTVFEAPLVRLGRRFRYAAPAPPWSAPASAAAPATLPGMARR
jgi:peptidoglycan/LPS O-acetylase OafA/YrhL